MKSVKAKLMLSVTSGLGAIFIGALITIFMLRGLAKDFDELIHNELAARHQVNIVLNSFKIQVQEWKNILIRGHQPEQLKKYYQRFEVQEQKVQNITTKLIANPHLEAQTIENLVKFKEIHLVLGEKYRKGLAVFKQEGFNTQVGDKEVSGIDRPSVKILNNIRDQINEQTNARSDLLSEKKDSLILTTVLILIGLAAITLIVLMKFIQSLITRPIQTASHIAAEIAAGNLKNTIHGHKNDEIGELLLGLATMQNNLLQMNADITAQMEVQKQQAQENGRIKQALDNVAAPVMLCDANDQVIYLNQQCHKLLTQYQTQIKKTQPQFSVNNLEQLKCHVLFDKQTQFSQLNKAQSQQVTMELNYHEVVLDIVAGPVKDDNNQTIGVVYEFTDLTEQRQAEQQIDDIIQAAVAGKLATRLEKQHFSGFLLTLANGINQMLDAIVTPINQTANYLNRIANGDIPQIISGEYHGDFLEIKNSLTKSTQAISRLITDTNQLVDAASQGHLKTRADEKQHLGDFKKIILGINHTLDVIVEPIDLTSQYLDQIAKGQIPDTISNQYHGDFLKVKNSLETCCSAIDRLIQDTNQLVDAATIGDLNVRADSSLHNGDFSKIIAGINNTLDEVVKPIDLTINYLEKIAAGNIPKQISNEFKGDFERVANSLKTCTQAVQAMVEDTSELAHAASQGELSQRANTQIHQGDFALIVSGVNQTLDAIENPLNECKEVMQALAQGNLSQTVQGDYLGEFDILKQSVNTSIYNLAELVKQITETANCITGSASDINHEISNLSSRTESQAASIEETTASMNELTQTVDVNSKNAQSANQLSLNTDHKASQGGELVNATVSAMQDISKSSDEISNIIEVINEIAFQTNLLALNAAVEAARAGEKGKGFAVVAAEVRQLAQRSANASKDIAQLISDSSTKVEHGMQLVTDSGNTLTEIVNSIKELSNLMNNIAHASKEQSSGISQINIAIKQMDEMTQQNNVLVEKSNASSMSMANQASELKKLMSKFVL